MSKYANAEWQGTAKEGKGTISTETKTLQNAPFTFASRFGEAKDGTNPEELVAAAHAGCFSMKFSLVLNGAGYTPDKIETKCDITFGDGAISKSHLTVHAKVPGISNKISQSKYCCFNGFNFGLVASFEPGEISHEQ